jgi:phytoene dehydrogenase-like protein
MKHVLVIGAGHNGLIAAFYLARAGYKPIVLERRHMPGGVAVTEEIAPGYRCPGLAHAMGPLRPAILRDMGVDRRVELLKPAAQVTALSPEGRALVIGRDVGRTAEGIRQHSERDATRYPEFCSALRRLGGFLAPYLDHVPPPLGTPSAGDLWGVLNAGRRFRALGRQDGYRLLRWMPMSVADLVGEYFETDLLRAAIAARAIHGTAAGPRSAGTGAGLLLAAALDPAPAGSSITAVGGPGALTTALAEAARDAGVVIRVDAPVARILVDNGQAVGVALEDGSEVTADAVVSNADPHRTLLGMVDPVDLGPTFLERIRHYRIAGTVAKVNLALGRLPEFRGIDGPELLHGRLHLAPGIDVLERAFDSSKYGQLSSEPYLDIAIPSLTDPSLCPPDRHVMSIHVQYAPYALTNGADWTALRDELGQIVLRTLERYAPGITELVEHRQILTPRDLEERYGLTGGHVHHGEPSIDQLFAMRPVLGWAQYRTPVRRLFLCGAGTHPGPGTSGASGRNAATEILKALK